MCQRHGNPFQNKTQNYPQDLVSEPELDPLLRSHRLFLQGHLHISCVVTLCPATPVDTSSLPQTPPAPAPPAMLLALLQPGPESFPRRTSPSTSTTQEQWRMRRSSCSDLPQSSWQTDTQRYLKTSLKCTCTRCRSSSASSL